MLSGSLHFGSATKGLTSYHSGGGSEVEALDRGESSTDPGPGPSSLAVCGRSGERLPYQAKEAAAASSIEPFDSPVSL